MGQAPIGLVTGAGRGAGRSIAVRLAAEGYRVALVSRTEEELHAAGIVGAVRCAALELARTGVTVNAVCPAFIDTPLTERTIDTIVERAGWPRERAVAYVNELQPIGRMVSADEVAEAVWACVANAAITGQALNVDGGLVQD